MKEKKVIRVRSEKIRLKGVGGWISTHVGADRKWEIIYGVAGTPAEFEPTVYGIRSLIYIHISFIS